MKKSCITIITLILLAVFTFSTAFAYGSFSSDIGTYYNKVTYTLNGTNYIVHVFKTNPSTQSVAPAVYTTGNKQYLSDMNVSGISASQIVAKTNAGGMESYGFSGDSFYGFYYVNGTLYMDGVQLSGTTDSRLTNLHSRYFPSFCIKKDGSANIRWFNSSNLSTALPYCNAIIGSCHPLVYAGKSVFESAVYDTSDGIRIADWNDLNNSSYHYNDAIAEYRSNVALNRAFLGHRPDKSFLMVITDTMDLRIGAKLMVDLGCDYAVNLDGSNAAQMRVAPGYTNGFAAGKVTNNGSNYTYYGTAVCAYNK